MKTAATIFIVIGMVLQFWLIYPIIVGIIALKKMNEAKSKDELTVIGIVTTFFCSLAGGILMLSIKEESFPKNEIHKRKSLKFERVDDEEEIVVEQQKDSIEDIKKELEEIKKLLDNDLISQEEYEKMRESIISKYYK